MNPDDSGSVAASESGDPVETHGREVSQLARLFQGADVVEGCVGVTLVAWRLDMCWYGCIYLGRRALYGIGCQPKLESSKVC